MSVPTVKMPSVRLLPSGNVIPFDEYKLLGGRATALTHAYIELIRADDVALWRAGHLSESDIRRIEVRALVDTGALTLAINETIQAKLQLPKLDRRSAALADGQSVQVDVVGPVVIRFENRVTVVNAVVLPGDAEVLLGAIPIEDMDVMIDLRRKLLIVNPEHPDLPLTFLK